MTFFVRLKSIDSSVIKLSEFTEIVDPVRAQCCGVSDKLTPHGSAEPVFNSDIIECVNRDHRR
jgi:hypothetical protein